MSTIIQPISFIIGIRIIEITISVILTYVFIYAIWYIIRGKHKNEQKSIKQKEENEIKKKSDKSDSKDSKSNDYCPLNEIMGYDFITIQHASISRAKTIDNNEKDIDWNKTSSQHLKDHTTQLDVTSSEAEKEQEIPMPDPAFTPTQKPKTDQIEKEKPSVVEKTITSTPGKQIPENENPQNMIEISESEALAMSDAGNPWPENEINEDPDFIDWMISGYEEQNGVYEVKPETMNEEEIKENSIAMMYEDDFDQILNDVNKESKIMINKIREL